MAITFYSSPRSSASPVAFALAELGVEHETINFDLRNGDAHKQPDYLKINPMGQVPALVDDGQAMFESSACIIHLGEKYGAERGLWPPPGSSGHMQALTWMAWTAVTLGHALRQGLSNHEWTPEALRSPALAAAGKEQFGKLLAMIDDRLASRTYILGDDFSLVDCFVGASVAWGTGVLEFDVSTTPNIGPWLGRCMAREGAKAMGL